MTISKTSNKITHVANGSNKTFTFNFRIDSESDVEIYYDGVLQTPTPLFSIDILDLGKEAGGDLVFDVAPPACDLTIYRKMELKQAVDYTAYGAFPAETHENALDKLIMITQQQQEQIDRVAFMEPVNGVDPLTLTTGLAIPTNKEFFFDTDQDTSLRSDGTNLLMKVNGADVIKYYSTGQVKYTGFLGWVSCMALLLETSVPDNYVEAAVIVGGELYLGGSSNPPDYVRIDGDWDGPHLKLGSHHLWVDSFGKLRIKATPPTGHQDGEIVGTQTL